MKLKDHPGFKRLAISISLLSLTITYFALWLIEFFDNSYGISSRLAFIEFPIIAILISVTTFVFVRITYWVIDGFRNEK